MAGACSRYGHGVVFELVLVLILDLVLVLDSTRVL